MNNRYLMKALVLGPIAIQRIIHQVSVSRWDEVTEPDRFTLREAISHLVDWEPIFRERIQLALSHSCPTITPYDESERAITQNYAGFDALESAAKFIEERAATFQLIESFSDSDWKRTFVHPEYPGSFTLYDMAVMIVGHDTYHAEHFTQYLG